MVDWEPCLLSRVKCSDYERISRSQTAFFFFFLHNLNFVGVMKTPGKCLIIFILHVWHEGKQCLEYFRNSSMSIMHEAQNGVEMFLIQVF